MHRRGFLVFGAAALAMPTQSNAAYRATEYVWGMRATLRESGQTVIYNFRASWSLTCQIKEELLADLKQENAAYQRLTFIDVDYDTFGPSQWVERMNVRRRSTLVVMKGDVEITRLENQPFKPQLRSLLNAALAA